MDLDEDTRSQLAAQANEEAGKLCDAWDEIDDGMQPGSLYTKPDIRRQAHNLLERLHFYDRPPGVNVLALFSRLLKLGDSPFQSEFAGTPSRAKTERGNISWHHAAPVGTKSLPNWEAAIDIDALHPEDPTGEHPSILPLAALNREIFGEKDSRSTLREWRKGERYREEVKSLREGVIPILKKMEQEDEARRDRARDAAREWREAHGIKLVDNMSAGYPAPEQWAVFFIHEITDELWLAGWSQEKRQTIQQTLFDFVSHKIGRLERPSV